MEATIVTSISQSPNNLMITIETKRLTLSCVAEEDFSTLYNWRNSDTFRNFCSTRRNIVDFDEFKDELSRDLGKDRHIQFMARRSRDLQPIGTIWAYNLNLTDGYIFITTFIDRKYQKIGYGIESFAGTIYYLFDKFPSLYKIYTEAYSYNEHSLSIMRKAGFSEEGIFRDHRLVDGNRHNLHRLAFYRSQFVEKMNFVREIATSAQLSVERAVTDVESQAQVLST